jgi:anthranilate phosphoribosyltransferase
MLDVMAQALARLGCDRALVVSSDDGLDEMSTSAATRVVEVNGTDVRRYEVTAADVGLPGADAAALTGGTPEENARVTGRILEGAPGPHRDIAVLNAGAAIYAAGRAADLAAGVAAAQEALDTGAAAGALERYVALSQELAPA